MSAGGCSNTEKRSPFSPKNSRQNNLTLTNPELFHMKPRPGGYVTVVPPYSDYSVAHKCCCVGDVRRTPPETRFRPRTYSPSPVQTGPTSSDAQNYTLPSEIPYPSTENLPLTSHVAKSVVSIGSTHSRALKNDHQVKCVAESGAIVFIPSRDFRLEQQALRFYETDMPHDEDQKLWQNDHFRMYDPSYDTMELLSGTISTVMLMAAGVTSIPEDHLYWTAQYLECMKDYEHKHPYNINGILSHMMWLKRDGREEFRPFTARNAGASGGIGPSGGLDGGVVSSGPREVDSSRIESSHDIPGGIDYVEPVIGGIDGSKEAGGSKGISLNASGTSKNASIRSSKAASPSKVASKGSARSKESTSSNKSRTVKYDIGFPIDRLDLGVDAGSQYDASPQNVVYSASQLSNIQYKVQTVASPYNDPVATTSMNTGKVASPRTGTPRIGTPSTGSPRSGNIRIDSPMTGNPITGSSRNASPITGSPTIGNPRIVNPMAGSARIGYPISGSSRNGTPTTGSSMPGSSRNASPRFGNSRSGSPKNGSKRTVISTKKSQLNARAQFPDQQDALNVQNQLNFNYLPNPQDQLNENIPQVSDTFKRRASNTSNNSQTSKSSRASRKSQVSYSKKVSHRSPDRFHYD